MQGVVGGFRMHRDCSFRWHISCVLEHNVPTCVQSSFHNIIFSLQWKPEECQYLLNSSAYQVVQECLMERSELCQGSDSIQNNIPHNI